MSADIQTWRIYIPELSQLEEIIKISHDEHHFIKNVLRMREEDPIEAFDGKGRVAQGRILEIGKKETTIETKNREFFDPPPFHINLIIGRPKTNALEELVTLCSEIGVAQITLVQASKSHLKTAIRTDRLEKLTLESLRVNKSYYFTQIEIFQSYEELFDKKSFSGHSILCDESSVYDTSLSIPPLAKLLHSLEAKQTLHLFIGPEASFTPQERTLIVEKAKAMPASLGSYILKVPTAAMVASVLGQGFLELHSYKD